MGEVVPADLRPLFAGLARQLARSPDRPRSQAPDRVGA